MWKARSGFSSTRTNRAPFTKDFRGGEHPRVYGIFGAWGALAACLKVGGAPTVPVLPLARKASPSSVLYNSYLPGRGDTMIKKGVCPGRACAITLASCGPLRIPQM